ncbi:MAG: FAD-dependent thymidylate synthase [Planctomycetes bacterium]|jgi:thymidylate synthase (FAD)|nr:FAD-dependent thymidylate synthase [Planctomycetota bacterium]
MDGRVHGVPLEVELVAITPEPEKVIEQAGRTCYRSFDRIHDDSQADFIRRLLKIGHESPLEHAYATFRIRNCSRAMTHQLVRHRLMAVSQQSQRYVDEEQFSYVTPGSLPPEFADDFHQDMRTIQQMYRKWRDRGLKKEDARFVLPNACVSEIVVSADLREWRHIFHLRLSPKAQWEIRQACELMLAILRQHAPTCFEDIQSG